MSKHRPDASFEFSRVENSFVDPGKPLGQRHHVLLGQLLGQTVDVSKYPDIADLSLRKCEYRSTGVDKTSPGGCQTEDLSLVGPRVRQTCERLVAFGDRGNHFIVKIGCESLDVVDVVAELVESNLCLPEGSTEVDLWVENLVEDSFVEPIPHVVVEAVDQTELLCRVHPGNLRLSNIP